MQPDQYGTLIDLSPLLDLSGTLSSINNNVVGVPLRSTSQDDFFASHRTDDAFTSYPYTYAIKRREAPTVLLQSLGATALLLWDALRSVAQSKSWQRKRLDSGQRARHPETL